MPVFYVNDAHGRWDGNRDAHVEQALAGLAGSSVSLLAPEADDRFLFKPRFSAFESTPLRRILQDLDVDRIVLVGTATEMCIAQTAIHGRDHELEVTVLRDACADVDPDAAAIAVRYVERITGIAIETTASWTASSG